MSPPPPAIESINPAKKAKNERGRMVDKIWLSKIILYMMNLSCDYTRIRQKVGFILSAEEIEILKK
jgi:hypothetical protein